MGGREVRFPSDCLRKKILRLSFLMLKNPYHPQKIESAVFPWLRLKHGLQFLLCCIELPCGNLFGGLLQE